ncbi:16549_t:CDS:2 [Racocetra persica]|uniref:16549_t:CDS:1 n=1 Tax=Racocetra persica TaxID=160502 RepID=A0ACA9KL12_9GLOM|nr:16549_t:CDS:2 [Racocetra persica]
MNDKEYYDSMKLEHIDDDVAIDNNVVIDNDVVIDDDIVIVEPDYTDLEVVDSNSVDMNTESSNYNKVSQLPTMM